MDQDGGVAAGSDVSEDCLPGVDDGAPRRLRMGRLFRRIGNAGNQVSGEHSGLTQFAGCQIASQPVQISPGTGRIPGTQLLRQQTDNDAGQRVTRASSRHTRIAGRTDGHIAVRSCHDGAGPF